MGTGDLLGDLAERISDVDGVIGNATRSQERRRKRRALPQFLSRIGFVGLGDRATQLVGERSKRYPRGHRSTNPERLLDRDALRDPQADVAGVHP